MIERVARAIYACDQRSVETPWEKLYDVAKDDLEDTARAALEAMREPTREMVWCHEMAHIGPEEIHGLWQAMIDEALK